MVAVFAKNLIHYPHWGQPRVLKTVRGWYRACVFHIAFFASRNSSNAKGVPTEDLIHRFQRGQPRAFEALYERFKDYVYRTAFFITRNSGDAGDLSRRAARAAELLRRGTGPLRDLALLCHRQPLPLPDAAQDAPFSRLGRH